MKTHLIFLCKFIVIVNCSESPAVEIVTTCPELIIGGRRERGRAECSVMSNECPEPVGLSVNT